MDIEILMRQFCDHALHMLGHSPETVRRYKRLILFFKKHLDLQNIEEVTETNLREFFIYGRTQRKWAPRTFILFHMTLGVFFRWCVKQGHMRENPVEGIEQPKVEKRIPGKFSRHEALTLLELVYNYPYEYPYLRYRNHALFSMFIFAGLRRSEALKLQFADVDFDGHTIFVRQGKGSKDRIIPMSHTLAHSLKRYVDERRRLRKTCPEFFTSLNRNMGFTRDGLKHLVVNLSKAFGFRVNVHKLRHTFATLMLEGGCDIYSLSRMMGHSDIKTTTIYLSASAEHLRSQMTKHPLNNPTRI